MNHYEKPRTGCKTEDQSASRAVMAMHELIFEKEEDRSNHRLREFRDFGFGDASPEFRAKLQCAVGFTIGNLISICNVLGIMYTGNAEQLQREVMRVLIQDIDSLRSIRDDEDDGSGDDNGDNRGDESDDAMRAEREAADRSVKGKRQNNSVNANQFVLNYREDSVRAFNGTNSYPIERWIHDFEEVAAMFNWNDLQMMIFAKRWRF